MSCPDGKSKAACQKNASTAIPVSHTALDGRVLSKERFIELNLAGRRFKTEKDRAETIRSLEIDYSYYVTDLAMNGDLDDADLDALLSPRGAVVARDELAAYRGRGPFLKWARVFRGGDRYSPGFDEYKLFCSARLDDPESVDSDKFHSQCYHRYQGLAYGCVLDGTWTYSQAGLLHQVGERAEVSRLANQANLPLKEFVARGRKLLERSTPAFLEQVYRAGIERAMTAGREIEAPIVTEYIGLFLGRDAWKLGRGEFIARCQERGLPEAVANYREMYIRQAIASGLDVPAAVRLEFPDLLAEYGL